MKKLKTMEVDFAVEKQDGRSIVETLLVVAIIAIEF